MYLKYVKTAKQATKIASSCTPFSRLRTSAAVSSQEVRVMSSSTFPTFRGRRLTDIAKQRFNNSPEKARNFLRMVQSNSFLQMGHENFLSLLFLFFGFPSSFPLSWASSPSSSRFPIDTLVETLEDLLPLDDLSSSSNNFSLAWKGMAQTSSISLVGIFIYILSKLGELMLLLFLIIILTLQLFARAIAMHHEKYRHFTSPLPKHYEEEDSQEHGRRGETNVQTFRHRPEPIMTEKREVTGERVGELLKVPSNNSPVAFSASQDDKRLRFLIADAISSADRAIKAILPYGHLEIQKHCSLYFLNREKLFSFLDNCNQSFYSSEELSSKKQKKKHRKREELSSELIEMVPINHLERLEKIVYNKIIPILQTEFDSQKRKSQKHPKKAKEWGNSDFKEGLILLERLNGKERIAVDQCAEILERFIIRIMEKEEKMLVRLAKLQERLDEQIKKTEILAEESKKWEEFRLKSEKEWGREKRNLLKYQEFSREVKSILSEKQKTDSQVSDKEGLENLLQQIKKMANNDDRKHSKKCDHRSHKEIHSNCKEESVRNEQQIKSLKDVVKSLDNEICLLRQECQSMENQIKENNEKTNKVETKSKKIIQENESMNQKIDQLIREDNYKGKLIEQYLRIISRLEESLKSNEENIVKLNQENEGHIQMVNKYSSEKEDYIRHIMEIEEKQKQLEEIIARKQIQIQELIIHLNAKDREVRDSENIIQKMQGEIHSLYAVISTKQETIAAHMKENEELNEQIKEHQKLQILKGSSHEDVSIRQQQNQKDHHSEIHIRIEEIQEERQRFQTLQHIGNHETTAKQDNNYKQVSMTLDSKTHLEQLKAQMKKISQENSQFKFQLQRIKTFKAIQHSNNSAIALNCQERQELNYLRNIVHNIGKAPKQQKPLQVIGYRIVPEEIQQIQKPLQKIERQESENAVDVRQLLLYTNLKAQKRDDFIPEHINKLVIPVATLEDELNEAALEENEKGSKRDDFIPAHINKQSMYGSKRNDQSQHHSLKDQMSPFQPKFDRQMASVLQPHTDELISQDLIEIREDNDMMKVQGDIVQAQPSKIQELLDLNVQIGQNFIKLKEKYQKQQKFSGELTQIKKEIDYMTALLNIYKHNTLKKLQKLKRTQLLHKQAEQEVERLKHRLDDAIGAIRPFSSIRTNSEGSGFSMPDHLQSFFKHNNPFLDQQHLNQNTCQPETRPKQNKEIFTQTDEQRNISKRLAVVAIESQVIIQASSPLVSEISERPACDVTKSFINQLENMSPSAEDNNPRIEPVINNTNTFLTPELLKEIPVDANPESSDSAKKQEQVMNIGNMINYHKHQIMNLHKMLRSESEEIMQQISTPKKHPFQNEEYMRYITNAPEKEKMESSYRQENRCDVACFHVEQIEQLKEMFAQRQQELSQLVVEKDQEIERLKSIIKTLTKVQQVEDKSSIKASRNRQSASREIEHLKNQNEHLWMFLEKEKSEIERLRILIQQYQLNEEIYKLKNGSSPHKDQEEHKKETTYDILMHQPIQANQYFYYERTPAKKQLEQVVEQQGDQLVKSQNLDVEVENHELLVESDRKAKEEPPVVTPLKVEESPTKRFARKSEKFQQQETPRQRRNTSPSKTLQMGWQQLVPEFFGQKSRKPSPRHSNNP